MQRRARELRASRAPLAAEPLPRARSVSLLPAPSLELEDERRAVTRLQLFMGTRLGVATLLLGGTLLIALEDQRGFDSFTPQFLVLLIASIYGGVAGLGGVAARLRAPRPRGAGAGRHRSARDHRASSTSPAARAAASRSCTASRC